MLKIEGLFASYGQNQVLHGLDINVQQGQIVSIIGSNGAGKSTLLNSISGLVNWRGKVIFEGKPLSHKSHKVVREGIFQVPEGRRVFAGLTVEENLMVGAYTNNSKHIQKMIEEKYELFPILRQRHRQDAGTLSGGEQQMLVICRALMGNPKLLLLDEPSLGLAPKIVKQVFATIQRIRDKGITIILVEQNAKKALSISDYAYVIENGRIAMSGPGMEVLRNPKIKNAYLGSKQKTDERSVIMGQTVDQLRLHKLSNKEELGAKAAQDAAVRLREIADKKGEVNVVFAAAPSQNEFLRNLLSCDLPFGKMRAFHMDEYIGLPEDHPAGFGNFLDAALFNKVSFMEVHYIGKQGDPQEIADQYASLLERYPPDIIFLGVGENGHLAFNDPPVADFEDPYSVKIVELEDACRRQQVNDGCFKTLEDVPEKAITLTMSQIMAVPHAFAIVPGKQKAAAINDMLNGPIAVTCPASVLRRHPNADLYIDADSASML